MFKHYLRTALRHFATHKVTTLINVLCLCVGLIAFAIAYGIAMYSSHGDFYNAKAARTYVLMAQLEQGGAKWSAGMLPKSGVELGPLLKSNFPELDVVARMSVRHEFTAASGTAQLFADGSYADAELLDVFDFDFVAGDRRFALRSPNSVVVRDELAQRLWGRLDVVGETLLLNNKVPLRVTGVMRAPREPSHFVKTAMSRGFEFSMLISMDVSNEFSSPDRTPMVTTYLVMPNAPANYIDVVRERLKTFGERYFDKQSGKVSFAVRPIAEIRHTFLERPWMAQLGLSDTPAMVAVGALVLLIACFSYANLAAAQATTRVKELAMRRVVGASHAQIAGQSFFEALLLTAFAGLLALGLLPFVSLVVKSQLAMDIRPMLLQSTAFPFVWLSTVISAALVACFYPALVMARIRPAQALQGSRAARRGRPVLRFLVIAQFAAAAFLLVAGTLMREQNNSLWQVAAKLQTDLVIRIDNNLRELNIDPEALKIELRKQPGIKSVSGIAGPPGGDLGDDYRIVAGDAEPSSRRWLAFWHAVDREFFATMNIPLLAGRNFSQDMATDYGDSQWYGNMIIDRALAAQYGWTNPQDAIGKHIYLLSSAAIGAPGRAVTVVGVVENRTLLPFSVMDSHSTAYAQDDKNSSIILVRIPKEQLSQGLHAIDKVWKERAPGVPLKRSFLDEQYEKYYRDVAGMAAGSLFIGVLTTLVAIMSLLGIATHSIAQRVFEIGVRRTLGASFRQVLALLLTDFSKPVIIANVIAWPFAFIAARIYRTSFLEPAPISSAPFIASLLIGIVIAWLVVIRQASKVARMNPARVLRHE